MGLGGREWQLIFAAPGVMWADRTGKADRTTKAMCGRAGSLRPDQVQGDQKGGRPTAAIFGRAAKGSGQLSSEMAA